LRARVLELVENTTVGVPRAVVLGAALVSNDFVVEIV